MFFGLNDVGFLAAVGAGPALWTPADITTALWLDAADASTVTTVSGAVSQWNDKSGNGRHVSQATAGSRPPYVASGLNGKNIVRFDSDFLSASAYNNPTSSYSIFDVTIREATLGGLGAIIGYQTSTSRAFAGFRDDNTLWHGAGGSSLSNVAFATSAGAYLFEYSIGSTAVSTLRVNAVVRNTITGYTETAGGSAHELGQGGGTGPIEGLVSIAERVLISSVISTDTRQRIEGYLAHKWGLTADLPNDHPYKTAAPTL
jgi:hypothetical protein